MSDTPTMAEVIHHVAADEEWAARSDESYTPAAFADEGFIHLCRPEQLAGVLDRYYRGRNDLRLLTVDPAMLPDGLVWEDTTGRGEEFPHLYGPLPLVAVRSVDPLNGPALEPDHTGGSTPGDSASQ